MTSSIDCCLCMFGYVYWVSHMTNAAGITQDACASFTLYIIQMLTEGLCYSVVFHQPVHIHNIGPQQYKPVTEI